MAAPVFLSRKEKSKNCPFAATAEKGRRYAEPVIDRYVSLLKEITEKGDIYL